MKNLTDVLLVAFTGLLAAFTYLLWRATSGLWSAARQQSDDLKLSIKATQDSADAARRSAEIAERTLVATHRPQIGLDRFTTKPIPPQGGPAVTAFYISALWRNRGATFAINAKSQMRYRVVDKVESGEIAFDRTASSGSNCGNIAPSGSIEAAGVRIPMTEILSVSGQSKSILVWAQCEYEDGLGGELPRRHHTECCYELEVASDTLRAGGESAVPFRFKAYHLYNSAS